MPPVDPLPKETAPPDYSLEQVRAVKQRHEAELLRQPGVVGVGIGLLDSESSPPRDPAPAIVITVRDPVPPGRFPDQLEGIPVQVRQVGTLRGL